MFLKHLDILTPRITLYQQGILFHSSIGSGIISLISFLITILGSIYYLIEFFGRKNPAVYYVQYFTRDAGTFAFDPNNLFHYISMINGGSSFDGEKFDFNTFRLIGTETYLNTYLDDLNKDLTKIDHWLYGPCVESDITGVKNLVNKNIVLNSACIRKFYSSSKKKYFNTNELNFRWPKIAHGTFNTNNKFYSVFLEKCQQDSLNIILGENNQCKTDQNINNIIKDGGGVHFNFVDHSIDVLDFDEPNKKFMYRIQSSLERENYSANHINFNPVVFKTSKNVLTDETDKEFTYMFETNTVFSNVQNGNGIYMCYYLWINNRIQHFERRYKKLQDTISDIGGYARVITFIASLFNYFYYNYITLHDTQNLIYSMYYNEENIKKARNIELNKNISLKESEKSYNKLNLSTNINREENNINNIINNNNLNDQKKKIYK